jgi:hypothetical protein
MWAAAGTASKLASSRPTPVHHIALCAAAPLSDAFDKARQHASCTLGVVPAADSAALLLLHLHVPHHMAHSLAGSRTMQSQ